MGRASSTKPMSRKLGKRRAEKRRLKSRIRIWKRIKSRMKSKIMKREVLAASLIEWSYSYSESAPNLIPNPNLHPALSLLRRNLS